MTTFLVFYHVNDANCAYIALLTKQANANEGHPEYLLSRQIATYLEALLQWMTLIWKQFVEGIDVEASHKFKAVCLGCGAIVLHQQTSETFKSNLLATKVHLRNCTKQLSDIYIPINNGDKGNSPGQSSTTTYSSTALQDLIFDMIITENLPLALLTHHTFGSLAA